MAKLTLNSRRWPDSLRTLDDGLLHFFSFIDGRVSRFTEDAVSLVRSHRGASFILEANQKRANMAEVPCCSWHRDPPDGQFPPAL